MFRFVLPAAWVVCAALSEDSAPGGAVPILGNDTRLRSFLAIDGKVVFEAAQPAEVSKRLKHTVHCG